MNSNTEKKRTAMLQQQDRTQITVAIIAGVATVLTIVGSIAVTNITNNAQLEQQRLEEARETKRTYYNEFIEAWTNQVLFTDKPNSPEKVEAGMKYVLEVNRLPLYASQEMVEFINNASSGNGNIDTTLFYDIMRRDLCSDNFEPFDNLSEISIIKYNHVVIENSEGKKIIQ